MQSQVEQNLPEELFHYVSSHYPLLGATVYVPQSGTLYPEYGIELLVEALATLKVIYPNIGTVIMGPTEEARKQIKGLRHDDHTVKFTGPLPHDLALGLMRKLTMFVRPTYTDGDSISVREAMALSIPVVASDTDYRPPGVIIFKKGNLNNFLSTMTKILKDPKSGAVKTEGNDEEESISIKSLLEIYRKIAPSFMVTHKG